MMKNIFGHLKALTYTQSRGSLLHGALVSLAAVIFATCFFATSAYLNECDKTCDEPPDSGQQQGITFYHETLHYTPRESSNEKETAPAATTAKPKAKPLTVPAITLPDLPLPFNPGNFDLNLPEYFNSGIAGDTFTDVRPGQDRLPNTLIWGLDKAADLIPGKGLFDALRNVENGKYGSAIKDGLLTFIPKGTYIGWGIDATMGEGWADKIEMPRDSLPPIYSPADHMNR